MKSKRILRFYFNAELLDKAIDKLILCLACKSARAVGAGFYYADRITELICAKDELSDFWRYVDGVTSGLTENDLKILRLYAGLRQGICRLPEEKQKEIKRAVIKFTRRARAIGRYAKATKLIDRYYCMI